MKKKYRLGERLERLGEERRLSLTPSRNSAHTLELCIHASKFAGVSRLADLTLLDSLGLQTWQAVRPLSKNLVVSQGKGPEAVGAKISALAESIELFCAEEPEWDTWASPISTIPTLTYDYEQLPGRRNDSQDEFLGIPRRWTRAFDLTYNIWTLIPTELVTINFTSLLMDPRSFRVTSNGLASGDTIEQAVLHGMLEVIERDAIGRAQVGRTARTLVTFKPDALDEPCQRLLHNIRAAGSFLDIYYIRSAIGLPTFEARIIGEDGRTFFGTAAHFNPITGLSSAIFEAAQSRLTAISGARDDISDRTYSSSHSTRTMAAFRGRRPSARITKNIEEIDGLSVRGKQDAIAQCSQLLRDARYNCIVVDIGSVTEDFHVAFVVIPKMQRTLGHA